MIVKKTWERFAKDKRAPGGSTDGCNYLDIYSGWFLLGILPLYVIRDRRRR